MASNCCNLDYITLDISTVLCLNNVELCVPCIYATVVLKVIWKVGVIKRKNPIVRRNFHHILQFPIYKNVSLSIRINFTQNVECRNYLTYKWVGIFELLLNTSDCNNQCVKSYNVMVSNVVEHCVTYLSSNWKRMNLQIPSEKH